MATTAQQTKTVTIIVNGQKKTVEKEQLTYEDVVALAGYQVPIPPNVVYDVSYSRAEGNQEGVLVAGGKPVKAQEGMQFRVNPSNRS
ncbi:MAG: multiubiquitin domain-containing protein [Thermoplasmatota archaeon]